MDAHIDTVGIGNIKNWDFDPWREGMETDELIGSRYFRPGRRHGVPWYGPVKHYSISVWKMNIPLLVTGTVQEEDCDGLCWQYIIEQSGIRPEFVVSTEPTDCQVYRGQRGRMEIRIDVQVLAATVRHQNAVITPFSKWVRFLANYKNSPNVWVMTNSSAKAPSPFLKFSSPPQAVALSQTAAQFNRPSSDLGRNLGRRAGRDPCPPAVQKANAVVSMYNYDRPSWTGLVYPTECYFPTWKVEEDHFTVKALVNAYEGLFGKAPVVDKWTFSTNGVSIMGRHGIPVIGFGPGKEPEAHAPNENLEISPGNLCRYVRCNPIKLAGNRIITLPYSLRFTGGFWSLLCVLIKTALLLMQMDRRTQDLLIESGIVRQLGYRYFAATPFAKKLMPLAVHVFLAAWMSIRISILMSASRAVVMIFLPVPAQLRVAVQQPLLTIWDLAQMAAGYAINWKFIAVMPPTKQSSTTAFTVSFNILITLSSTKFR